MPVVDTWTLAGTTGVSTAPAAPLLRGAVGDTVGAVQLMVSGAVGASGDGTKRGKEKRFKPVRGPGFHI